MSQPSLDTFKCRRTLEVGGKTYTYFSLPDAEKNGLAGYLPPALLAQGAAGEPAPLRGRAERHGGRHPRRGRVAREALLRPRDRLPAGARADAGFHRRAGGGRPRRHARRHDPARRRPAEDQSAGAGRPRHRPLRHGRLLRLAQRVREERRHGIRAERRALHVPALGPDGVRELPRRAAGHRHLPPGEPRISGADGVDARRARGRQDRHLRLPRHPGRHRLPHDDGERPRGARLGRRRHRGGGGHARPADLHAHPRGDRLPHRPASCPRGRPRPTWC